MSMPHAKQPEGHLQELHTIIVTLTEGSLKSLEKVSKRADRGGNVTRVVIFTGHVPSYHNGLKPNEYSPSRDKPHRSITPQQKKFIFSDAPLKMLNGALGRLKKCTTVHITDSSEMLQQGSFCFERRKRPTQGQLGNQSVHDNKTNAGHDKLFLHRAVSLMMSAAAGCSGISTIQIAIGSIESLCPLTSDALQLVRQQKGRSEEAFGTITSLSLKLDPEKPSKSSHLQSFLEKVTLEEVQLPSGTDWVDLGCLRGDYCSNCAIEMKWCMSEDNVRAFCQTISRKQILADPRNRDA
ncbi:hypothetical protein PCL_07394 [Purpureocillium lilacinum]|uniref:Uncharacterized protein n=1 Tax=Purpureocillium lilacinum TaxID=33203 RepID=A0A2U3DS77_PURLI|nr:hypothetical protein PCL_07394 [Purpureocillium lilacinum]